MLFERCLLLGLQIDKQGPTKKGYTNSKAIIHYKEQYTVLMHFVHVLVYMYSTSKLCQNHSTEEHSLKIKSFV